MNQVLRPPSGKPSPAVPWRPRPEMLQSPEEQIHRQRQGGDRHGSSQNHRWILVARYAVEEERAESPALIQAVTVAKLIVLTAAIRSPEISTGNASGRRTDRNA